MLNSSPVSRGRIAILNANWLVHPSVWYMAAYFEKEGYQVDLFLYAADESFSRDLLKESEMIKIHRLGDGSPIDAKLYYEQRSGLSKKVWHLARMIAPKRFRRKIWEALQSLLINLFPRSGLVPEAIHQKTANIIGQNPYLVLLGVEKGGLYWAGEVANRTNIPLAYYSLELFAPDDPSTMHSNILRRLVSLEEKYHRKCVLTIVQDVERGKALLSNNRIRNSMKMAYLPVSLSGEINRTGSKWLQHELELPPESVVILYFGLIWKRRFCAQLATVAQSFPETWRLVFHGPGSAEEIEDIRQMDKMGRTGMSSRFVPAREREAVVRSAHIGLALYSNDSLNDILTGFASDKIAMYFKCGVPLISFRYPSYEHIEHERAGILVDRIEEIPAAIQKILSDYNGYAQRAYDCYQRHYCFETNFSRVFASLLDAVGCSVPRGEPG